MGVTTSGNASSHGLPTLPLTGRPLADVSVFGVQRRTGERHKRPWVTRWAVGGRQRGRSFRTKAEAERFRSGLLVAVQSGEAFDDATGEPGRGSRLVSSAAPPSAAPSASAPRPPDTRVRGAHSSHSDASQCRAHSWARMWSGRWCLQLGQLSRPLLSAVEGRLGVATDGSPLGPATAGRYRKVSRACIRRAVELGVLQADPWPPPSRGRSKRKATRVVRKVNVRSLPDPDAMARVIDAIESHQPASRTYRVMTAVAFYGGLRPSEVVMLRAAALDLPPTGWGRIDVREADVAFDQPGEPKTGPGSVPIPPVLVDLLSRWLWDHGLAGGDLLFRTRNARRPTGSNWSRALQRGARIAGCPLLRIYDCRHAAATTWLRAGVPLGEVAKRLGHSVETLVSTYVGALESDEALGNDRIEAALSAPVVRLASA